MESMIPRIVIAGTNSGCGKTTVTCALLQALVNRGMRVGAFKCGPDYIDPMFHSHVIGAKSSNLDLFFLGENTLKYLITRNSANCDISVMEGVMGYYDGRGLTTTKGSTYEIAKVTQSPVVLVIDAKGASLSILATIKGFLSLYTDSRICGVILNQCSAMSYSALSQTIGEHFGGQVQPLGYFPKMQDCVLESRHLGLITAAEVENLKEKLNAMAEQAEKTINIRGLLTLAQKAKVLQCGSVDFPRLESVRIAVAKDRAFCFYYEDSLQALRELGAELVAFSPLHDEALPGDIHGLYIGGGYPELYAKQLSKNKTMLESVRKALEGKLPCIAECGGFMYLTQAIAGYPMVNHLPGTCFDNGKLTRFGYIKLRVKEDNLLCKAGEEIPAHEFHHWDCTYPGSSFTAEKGNGRKWDCAIATDTLYAGFPHFHFYANPALALNFYQTCVKEKHRYD